MRPTEGFFKEHLPSVMYCARYLGHKDHRLKPGKTSQTQTGASILNRTDFAPGSCSVLYAPSIQSSGQPCEVGAASSLGMGGKGCLKRQKAFVLGPAVLRKPMTENIGLMSEPSPGSSLTGHSERPTRPRYLVGRRYQTWTENAQELRK